MAIGDQHNDLEMIAQVGHGVAMPSAPRAVLDVARYVAPPLAATTSLPLVSLSRCFRDPYHRAAAATSLSTGAPIKFPHSVHDPS